MDTAALQAKILDLEGALNAILKKGNEQDNLIQYLGTLVSKNESDPFRIPDPIKSLPPYDGNRRQLAAWLRSAESTFDLFSNVSISKKRMYLQAIMNKLEGKARDTICLAGEIDTFEEFKTILMDALGDRQELSTYKSQLWQNKMLEGMTIYNYYQKTKEIVQNIKTLSKQNETFRTHWEAINLFIDQDALAAFVTGLRKPYFGYAQAARPKDIEEAYAFLCKFTSNEKASLKTRQFTQNAQKTPPNSAPFNPTNSLKRQDEPMEIDPSLRSRLTFNKKLVNNHECAEENDENDEIDDEDESFDLNFWEAMIKPEVT